MTQSTVPFLWYGIAFFFKESNDVCNRNDNKIPHSKVMYVCFLYSMAVYFLSMYNLLILNGPLKKNIRTYIDPL